MPKGLSALVGLFLGLIATFQLAFSEEKVQSEELFEIQQIISDQVSAFRAGDGEKAFSFASPAIRLYFKTPDKFMTMVKRGYLPIYQARSFNFLDHLEREDIIFQEVEFVNSGDSRLAVAVYKLIKLPDKGWRIAGVQLKPSEAREI